MKAICLKEFGGPEQLYLGEQPTPVPAAGELLVNVHATALNRADTLQRKGHYPPPPGASDILGLEMAGTVAGWGDGVSGFEVGDPVCGLLPGGGYAQQVSLPAELALRLPANLSFTKAAAIPEVFLTAFQAVNWLAQLQAGERILIHAGASGVGTAAIQLARQAGASSIIITASARKHEFCLDLGAHHAIDYKNEDFAKRVHELTDGKGVDVVIDFVGGPNFARNLDVLAPDGRMVMLAFLGGPKVGELNLVPILRKRLKIMGSTLRARSLDYKSRLTDAFRQQFWPLFASGELRPIVDTIYDWQEVAEAHRYMESNGNTGKIVMTVGE